VTHPLLDFSVEGFRCFRERVDFRDPGHVNVIAGSNNSGKSTLLSVLRRMTTTHFQPVQQYRGVAHVTGDEIDMLRFPPSDVSQGLEEFRFTFHNAIDGGAVLAGTLARRLPVRGGIIRILFAPMGREPSDDDYANKDPQRRAMNAVLQTAGRKIVFIPARRRVQPLLHESDLQDPEESTFDGAAVLPRLLGYANPSQEFGVGDGARAKFIAIEKTMSSLLDSQVRLIPLPVERDVEVTVAGKTVGLQRLGAGLEQLLVFAVAFVEHPEDLLLVEEPENYLHPTLQRRVLEHLLHRVGDSVVTTHSNHLLDVRDPRIVYYRTFHRPGEPPHAGVERVSGDRRYDFLWDLGVRPSSLFEANTVVWVEGPSDAILLRAWLLLMPEAAGLIEGVHFTFGFHAGSLLDKFFIEWHDAGKTDEQRIVDFCALHPRFFIVADSDGDGVKEYGHEYLQRIAANASELGILWTTQGKEVENYLPTWLLERYLTTRAKPRREVRGNPGAEDTRWKPVWRVMNALAGEDFLLAYPNKVAFAEWVAEELRALPEGRTPDDVLGVLDLKTRLLALVTFIRRSNGPDAKA
jgi:energy-coupling factor transporter ATP-binding protein EcfA2